MKIAISTTRPDLDADIDPRFGRSQYFIIVDTETMDFVTLENPGASAGGGAGITTAQTIVTKGVDAVLTGNCGPNAYQVLVAGSIKVVTGVSGKVRDAVQNYVSGKLQAAAQPNVAAHSGMGRGMGGGRGMGRR
jgi:predicted Fe-Mo cluster-binding NifX family protein